EGMPIAGASGSVKLSDGSEVHVMTDVRGEVSLTDVPKGPYTFKLDEVPEGTGKKPPHGHGPGSVGDGPGGLPGGPGGGMHGHGRPGGPDTGPGPGPGT